MSTESQNARRAMIVRENILMDVEPPADTLAGNVLAVAVSLRAQNVIMLIGNPASPNDPDRDRWSRWCRAYVTGWWTGDGRLKRVGGLIEELQFRCSSVGVAETVRCTFIAHGFQTSVTGCLATVNLTW